MNNLLRRLINMDTFETGIDRNLADFADNVIEGLKLFIEEPYTLNSKVRPFAKLWESISFNTFGRMFYRNLAVSDQCTGCGTCATGCPDNNLIRENGKLIIIKDNGCLRCLRCVQSCSNEAINFTSAKRRGTYSRKCVKELFEKACEKKVLPTGFSST